MNGKKSREFDLDDESLDLQDRPLSLKVPKIEEVENRSNFPLANEFSLEALNQALDQVQSPVESLQELYQN